MMAVVVARAECQNGDVPRADERVNRSRRQRGHRPVAGSWRGEPMARAATQTESDAPDTGKACEEHRGDLSISSSCPKAITQASLPPLRWLLQPDTDRFAHPAERELSRLLSFYGVRWAYEPTTFAVRWSSDGTPIELVTPDFYLPDHDRYLELTTMRQRLVTRKNRKFRKLRECYPNVHVRILYLRDFERLQDAFGPAARNRHERQAQIGSTLIAAQELNDRIASMARQFVTNWHTRMSHEAGQQRPLLLGVGQGSERFLDILCEKIREMGCPVDQDWIGLSNLADQPDQARARVTRPAALPVSGRHVVLAQEVLSTGLSAAFLSGWLRRQGATGVEVCALLDRDAARIVEAPVMCRGFRAPDVSLAGFGLTRWRAYSHLPYIAEIEIG